jgi:hypothetical protein
MADQPLAGRVMHCVPPGVSVMLNDAPFVVGLPTTVAVVFFERYRTFLLPDGGFVTKSFLAAAPCGNAKAIPPDATIAATASAMVLLMMFPPLP